MLTFSFALPTAVFAIAMVNNELVDAVVIMFIVVANAVIGFIQEWKSEMSLNALQRMSAGTAEVVRNGSSQVVGIDEVVVGDVVILKQGYQVPADARLVEAINLEVDEALLTGESMPVVKHTLPLDMPEQVRHTRNISTYSFHHIHTHTATCCFLCHPYLLSS